MSSYPQNSVISILKGTESLKEREILCANRVIFYTHTIWFIHVAKHYRVLQGRQNLRSCEDFFILGLITRLIVFYSFLKVYSAILSFKSDGQCV